MLKKKNSDKDLIKEIGKVMYEGEYSKELYPKKY
jgi:hypothetical protein